MKARLPFLLITFILHLITEAQTTLVYGGFSQPTMIQIEGEYLYTIDGDEIERININQSNPIPETIIDGGLISPQNFIIKDDIIYIAHGDKISKANLTSTFPTTFEDVITNIDTPHGLSFDDNILYISFFFAGKIGKINVDDSNPVYTDVITNLSSPIAMRILNNTLYFGSTISNTFPNQGISKIDLNATNPTAQIVATGLSDPKSIIAYNNYLVFSERGNNVISKIDLSQSNASVETIINTPGIWGLAKSNDILYFTELLVNGRVMKVDQPLSLSENKKDRYQSVYPNPSKNRLHVTNAPPSSEYFIFNQLGQKIANGIYDEGGIIISDLPNGTYLIKINGITNKFLKI